MDNRLLRWLLTLGCSVIIAVLSLWILNVFLPGCTDVGERKILCMGGLGEPAWKSPLVFLLVSVVSGTVILKGLNK